MFCKRTWTRYQKTCRRLSQGEFYPFTQEIRDLRHRVERDGGVLGIEQTIHACPAGLEPLGDFRLADVPFVHHLLKLAGELELDRRRPAFFQNPVLGQEVLKL